MTSKSFIIPILIIAITAQTLQNTCCSKPETISVTGTATVNVPPDIATLTITVNAISKTSQLAQSNANVQTNSVLSILTKSYIPSADIQTSWISINAQYDYSKSPPLITGQQASQTITAIIRNIGTNGNKLGSIIDGLVTINGITLSGPNFGLSDSTRNCNLIQARSNAWSDALSKAQQYASVSKVTLGNPIRIIDNPSSTSSESGPIYFAKVSTVDTTVSSGSL
jgi:hypothetical protein